MSREWNIIHHLIIVKHLPLDAHNTHLTAFYKNVRRVTAVSSICNNADVEIICWISQPNMACIIKYTYLCSSQNHVSFRTYSYTLPTRGRVLVWYNVLQYYFSRNDFLSNYRFNYSIFPLNMSFHSLNLGQNSVKAKGTIAI